MSATLNTDGSVTLVDGRTITIADIESIMTAQPAFRPLVIETGSGRIYGNSGTPRYGIWFSELTGSWHYLDMGGNVIPGTSWKARNLNRAKFTFGSRD